MKYTIFKKRDEYGALSFSTQTHHSPADLTQPMGTTGPDTSHLCCLEVLSDECNPQSQPLNKQKQVNPAPIRNLSTTKTYNLTVLWPGPYIVCLCSTSRASRDQTAPDPSWPQCCCYSCKGTCMHRETQPFKYQRLTESPAQLSKAVLKASCLIFTYSPLSQEEDHYSHHGALVHEFEVHCA